MPLTCLLASCPETGHPLFVSTDVANSGPVLVGDEDEGCLEPALMLKRTIPAAGLAVLPRTGHTNLEESDVFNRLRTHSSSPSPAAFYVRSGGSGDRRALSNRGARSGRDNRYPKLRCGSIMEARL